MGGQLLGPGGREKGRATAKEGEREEEKVLTHAQLKATMGTHHSLQEICRWLPQLLQLREGGGSERQIVNTHTYTHCPAHPGHAYLVHQLQYPFKPCLFFLFGLLRRLGLKLTAHLPHHIQLLSIPRIVSIRDFFFVGK